MTTSSESLAILASLRESIPAAESVSLPIGQIQFPRGVTFLAKLHAEGRFTAACQAGILIPILVDQSDRLIDGLRRCQAAWTLQHTHIPARRLPRVLTEEELLRLRVFLNPDRMPSKTTIRKLGGNPIGRLPVDRNSTLPKLARAEAARHIRDQERRRVLEFVGGGKHGREQGEIARSLVRAYEGLQGLLQCYPQQWPATLREAVWHIAQASQRVINFRQT